MSKQNNSNDYQILQAKIAEQESELALLRHQSALQEQLLDLNKDFVFVKDRDANFVFANETTKRFYAKLGYEDILGKKLDKIFPESQLKRFKEQDRIALKDGTFESSEKISIDEDDDIYVQVIKKRFFDQNKRQLLLCICRDITEKEKLINDLKRSNADLDNFAYVASHDLRAPLNAIKTMVNWTIEDSGSNLPSESLDNLQLVINRAERMEALLKDLLNYSRIGRDKQSPKHFNMRDKVFELLNLLDLPMGFSLSCDNAEVYLPELPMNVILINLIGNAIKHHDSAANAKIHIAVKELKRTTLVTVSDNGPGVPDDYKQKVFQLFQTLKPRDELEASGMGLSVVKKLVEQYGGKIEILDSKPRGTQFKMSWPKIDV